MSERLENSSCTRKFKMVQFSCNAFHIVPLIIKSKKPNHMISVRCCVLETSQTTIWIQKMYSLPQLKYWEIGYTRGQTLIPTHVFENKVLVDLWTLVQVAHFQTFYTWQTILFKPMWQSILFEPILTEIGSTGKFDPIQRSMTFQLLFFSLTR